LALGPPLLGWIAWPEIQARYRAWQAQTQRDTKIVSPVRVVIPQPATSSGMFGDTMLGDTGRKIDAGHKPIVIIRQYDVQPLGLPD